MGDETPLRNIIELNHIVSDNQCLIECRKSIFSFISHLVESAPYISAGGKCPLYISWWKVPLYPPPPHYAPDKQTPLYKQTQPQGTSIY